jgi:nucleoside-diphosphate-sugar epimerase
MRGATIAVTGAAGFIGTALCARLLGLGAHVTAIVRPGSDRPHGAAEGGLSVRPVDLSDRRQLESALAAIRPDFVFHLANGDHRRPVAGLADARASLLDGPTMFVNLLGALAQAAAPPQCVVRAGSLAEYGPINAPYREDQREEPTDSHAAAALAATRFGVMLAPRLPFALVNARLALTYGPGQSTRFLIPSAIEALSQGRTVQLARPHDRRDLIHVDDVIDGLVALAGNPFQPVVNLCTGIAPAMHQVIALIADELGRSRSLIEFAPTPAPGGVADLRGSPEAALAGCGWRARIGIEDGIARTVAAAGCARGTDAMAC